MDKDLFESFCGGINYPAPFSYGDHSYATDGRYLVRTNKIEGYEEDEKRGTDADNLLLANPNDFVAVVSMNDIEVDPATCPVCKGEAKPKECPECFGAGVVEFDTEYNDYEVDCKTCDGGGQINSCSKCYGSGVDSSAETQVMGIYFMSHLLHNVKKLPNCQLKIRSDKTKPSVFTFDGGDGLIMCKNK